MTIKIDVDEICTCGRIVCTCAPDFADMVDDEWQYHYLNDPWDAITEFRKYASAEEWNKVVNEFRVDSGAEPIAV